MMTDIDRQDRVELDMVLNITNIMYYGSGTVDRITSRLHMHNWLQMAALICVK